MFKLATLDLCGNGNFTGKELGEIFDSINSYSVFHSFSQANFISFFDGSKFTGKQRIETKKDKTLDMIGKKGESAKITKVTLVQSFDESILARLRKLINQKGLSL